MSYSEDDEWELGVTYVAPVRVSSTTRFQASDKIRKGEPVYVDEDGRARGARIGRRDEPGAIGVAVDDAKRGGDGGLVVDVRFQRGWSLEPDLAADFDREARQSLALVRREEAIVRKRARREIRRRKQKGRRR